jgi:hypothetical protein
MICLASASDQYRLAARQLTLGHYQTVGAMAEGAVSRYI